MTLRPCCFCALILAATLAAACDVHVGENGVSLDVSHAKAVEEWSRSYTLTKGGSLEIVNANGAIVLNGGTGPQVEVKATRDARGASDEEAQALLKQMSIEEEVSPTHVAIRSGNGNGLLRGRRSLSVEYHVTIPPGLEVSVKTENGGIGLHDVDGTVTASTTNGGIRGTNIAGAVSAHIVNGAITMEVTRPSGPIELDAVNGGIRLDVPGNLKADVEASAVNGGVLAEDGLAIVTSDKTRTRLTGKMNGGGARVSASTVNGGVRIGVLRPGLRTQESDKEALGQTGAPVTEKR
jgi:hypothetical protein